MRLLFAAVFVICFWLIWFFLSLPSHARDDGRYTNSPLKSWFDSLNSGNGACCSYTDGRTVEDPDVEMDGNNYRVRVDGQWLDVPDNALVTVPNRFGQAVVWPYKDYEGHIIIRCFLPGAGT